MLHLMDLKAEDWLKDVETPEELDVKRQVALRQKLLDMQHETARSLFELFPQLAQPRYHLFLPWLCA